MKIKIIIIPTLLKMDFISSMNGLGFVLFIYNRKINKVYITYVFNSEGDSDKL